LGFRIARLIPGASWKTLKAPSKALTAKKNISASAAGKSCVFPDQNPVYFAVFLSLTNINVFVVQVK
jgi:hypothetical protein